MIQFPKPNLEQFYRTYRIGSFAIDKAESQVALATDLSGKFNVWGLDLPNLYPYPLTYQDQMPQFLHFDPLDRYLLVGFDTDGDENTQMYAISRTGGAIVPLRTAPGKRHYFGAFSADGQSLYYSSDKDNAMFMNIYRYDFDSDEETVLMEGANGMFSFDAVAPDGSSWVYNKAYSNTFAIPYLVQDGAAVCMTGDEETPHVGGNARYLDADTILFITNYQSEHPYVAKYSVSTRSFVCLFSLEGHDIMELEVHRDTGTVYCVAMRGVADRLFAGQADTGEFHELMYPGSIVRTMQVTESGTLYAILTQENRPANLFRREVDGTWSALTNNRVLGVAEEDMVCAEVVRYPSFDGLEIEAMLYRAREDVANGHTIIMPHGGPQSADRKSFWSLDQFLLSRGYNIFAPNFRGSSGYGTEFVRMVERDWGGGARLDMVAGMEWLITNGLAEREKLFVVGGSYGGYMSLLLHGRHADYFRAVVDIFGPSNMFTFINSVPESWKPAMDQMVGHPERDHDKLVEDSPITYLDGMTKPMLVIQGANDPRVVQSESDQIVQALREQGRDVEYIVLPDEGHGFSKKENELKVYKAVADFLERHQASV